MGGTEQAAVSFIGKDVASYGLAEVLGQGGMSIVYRAVHKTIGKEAAVKLVTGAETDDAVKRLLHEAVAASSVSHPDVVEIFDFGHIDNAAYIIMELLRGQTVADRLRRRGLLEPLEAARFARQACGPLAAAHDEGIVHRDVKPQNLFIVRDVELQGGERIKLLDFGVAKMPASDAQPQEEGMLLGTPLYMAPEQFTRSPVDARTDVYQLGAVLYHMVCGRPPFANGTSLPSLILESAPERPSRVASVPLPLENIILRCLAKDPDERYQTIRELEEELRALLSEKGDTDLNVPTLVSHVPDLNRTSLADNISRVRSAQTLVASSVASGFFDHAQITGSRLFPEGPEFFKQVQHTFEFYRSHLDDEYRQLTTQIERTHRLWIACVGLGFLVLLAAIVSVLLGRIPQGVASALATTLVLAIAKLFQKREDYYRDQKSIKMKHLQYGNDWLLLIQSIEAIPGIPERHEEQRRLARVLLDKIKARTVDEPGATKTVAKKKRKGTNAALPPGD